MLDENSINSKSYKIAENVTLVNRGDLMNVKQFEIEIDVTSHMSPRSYLLVYYFIEDEVVADTLPLSLQICFSNQVRS